MMELVGRDPIHEPTNPFLRSLLISFHLSLSLAIYSHSCDDDDWNPFGCWLPLHPSCSSTTLIKHCNREWPTPFPPQLDSTVDPYFRYCSAFLKPHNLHSSPPICLSYAIILTSIHNHISLKIQFSPILASLCLLTFSTFFTRDRKEIKISL